MAHYSYADFRPYLTSLGIEFDLYTSTNISELEGRLEKYAYDAIIIGTNALHDTVIRSCLSGEALNKKIERAVDRGIGLLVLMQYKLAQNKGAVSSFVSDVGPVVAVARAIENPDEKAVDGHIFDTSVEDAAPILVYPNKVEPNRLAEELKNNRSIRALYWHWWGELNSAVWDVVLDGTDSPASPRPLVAVAKNSDARRVVFCSIPIDWMRPEGLTKNLVLYVCAGIPDAAIVTQAGFASYSFEYLRRMFFARRLSVSEYALAESMPSLSEGIERGVHRVLVLEPGVDYSELPENVREACAARVERGALTLIQFESGDVRMAGFRIAGRQRESLNYLGPVLVSVGAQLKAGVVDGSFWSTIEILQTLQRLSPAYRHASFDAAQVLSKADFHDRDGSYDEVFGVSVAFAWLRGLVLGNDAQQTQKTVSWLRANLATQSELDQLSALSVFSEIGVISDEELQRAQGLAEGLDLGGLTEIQTLSLLRSSLGFLSDDFVGLALDALLKKLSKGGGSAFTSDIPLAANLVSTLIDARDRLGSSDGIAPETWRVLKQVVFDRIIEIQAHPSIARADKDNAPWWDGSWTTAVKCLEAWVKFDEGLELPVYEGMNFLKLTGRELETSRIVKRDLAVFKELTDDLISKKERVEELASEALKLGGVRRGRRLLALGSVFLLYALGNSIYAAFEASTSLTTWGYIQLTIADHWQLHLGIASLFVAILGGERIIKFFRDLRPNADNQSS